MKSKVMYHGERIAPFGGKVVQYFKNQDGKGFYFSGIKCVWPGEIYQLESGNKMFAKPKRLYDEEAKQPWTMTKKDWAEFEAQKEIVKHHRRSRRKEMILKRPHPDIVRAVALLKPFYRALDHLDQSRFTKYLANQMSKKPK